jgi:hypothetical protein
MSGLPFVVQPRLKAIIEYMGSEESGQIAIERRGYLSSGEKAFVQQALGNDETSLKIISLSRKVASHYKMELSEAYEAVVSIIRDPALSNGDPRAVDIEAKYFDELNDLLSHLASIQSREQMLKALCMVQYRIDSEYKVSDILSLHPDIINDLAQLYNDEESKSISRLMEAEGSGNNEETTREVDVNELEKKPRKGK